MDKDAEKVCKSCHGCQLVTQPTPKESMKRFEMPNQPWLDVAVDLLGPMPEGEYILAVVDYYSRYFEVDINKSITSASNQVFEQDFCSTWLSVIVEVR